MFPSALKLSQPRPRDVTRTLPGICSDELAQNVARVGIIPQF